MATGRHRCGASYLAAAEGATSLTSFIDGNCPASQPPPIASINCTLAVI